MRRYAMVFAIVNMSTTRYYTISQKGCHHKHGYNFVNS